MIEIRHKRTGEVLHSVEADTLIGAILTNTDLTNADLRDVYLNGVHMSGANLSNADLSSAHMSGADLTNADLSGANLSSTFLSHVNLNGTDLNGTDLSYAKLTDTIFINCPTLQQAKGLEMVVHRGASTLDARTLRACVNHLPAVFLRGIGYTNEEIENLRAMYASGI